MRTLKLLLTDKYYRWATIEALKIKLSGLPGVKNIVFWNYAHKVHKMNQWAMPLNDSKIFFFTALVRLKASLESQNKRLFEEAKSDLLRNELINEPTLQEFREWLVNINEKEEDLSKIEKLLIGYRNRKA